MIVEFIACFEASNHWIWLRNLVISLRVVDDIEIPLKIYCDNNSAVLYSNNNRSTIKSKFIDIKFLVVKERIQNIANGTKEEEGFYREVWKEVPSRPPRVVTPDRPPRVVAPDRPPLPSPFRGMRPTEKRLPSGYHCSFIALQREREMEGIEHRTVEVNGIKMHIAEKGEGPVVLFLHGFPELWHCWHNQIVALGSLGYHAVAPDLRGYGDTDAPPSIDSYTCFHIVADLVALIDSLGAEQVFLVAHDWGAIIGWYLCMFRPDKVKAYVCLSVPFIRRNPNVRTVDGMRAMYGEDYYICRFQKPGEMEAQMAQVGTEYVLKNILTIRKPGPPIFPKGEFGTGLNPNMSDDTLPSWLTDDDLAYYVSKYEKSGFTGPLNYYRNMNLNWELTAPWTGVQIQVAVKYITGELDMVYTSLGMKEYVHSGGFKQDVPNLQVVVQKGVAHFNNLEAAEEINNHIYDFINKF
ncbi:Epoxide hydrolase A isoform A [Glycine soja]|nr:Epoxide hydrolase A isoform A [Glycine soja]